MSSASDVGDLTQCERKRKCRYEDKDDRGLKIHSRRFARSLPNSSIQFDTAKTVGILRGDKSCLLHLKSRFKTRWTNGKPRCGLNRFVGKSQTCWKRIGSTKCASPITKKKSRNMNNASVDYRRSWWNLTFCRSVPAGVEFTPSGGMD